MGVLNKKGALILALVVFLLSAVISFWINQRQSGADPSSGSQEAAMSHPLPGEMTPPGIPLTPVPPGNPITTVAGE